MKETFVSVCMATYNGEQYIRKQVDSILAELTFNDELIIVDDCSTDKTPDIIKSYGDPRIRPYFLLSNHGHVRAFEKALFEARNEVIFLSDQDDIWVPGRRDKLISKFLSSRVVSVTGRQCFIDHYGNKINTSFSQADERKSFSCVRNIIDIFLAKSGYYGCAMAFRRGILDICLPFPRFVEAHDLWIALVSNMLGGAVYTDDIVVKRRIHGDNCSLLSRPLYKKIRSRVFFLYQIAIILLRMVKQRIY